MNKSYKYAKNGAIAFAVLNGFINAFKQLNSQEDKLFNWGECFLAVLKGGFVGGVGGYMIGMDKDKEMSGTLIKMGGTVGVIKEALESYCDDDETLSKKAKKIQKIVHNEFKNSLSEYPTLNGSFAKGTAIQNSDIDIQVKFNKKAGSIESVRNKVEEYFSKKFYDNRLLEVRSQNHSVGLLFDIKGEEQRIDIVPMREIENGKGDTFLYSTKYNSIKKTNAKKQEQYLKFTEKQKQIIKILKGWKIDNKLKLPSIFIEHIVVRAFTENIIPRGIDKATLYIIEYIANNIITIRIVDSANTNNIISNCLSNYEKIELQNFCYSMIENIENDKRNILNYFNA